MAIEYKTITYRTCEGLDNLRFSWCELSKSHVSQRFGTIKQISIPNRLENENYLCTEPRYLGVWERAENGELVHLGNSKNTVTQELGRVSVWEFDSVKNTGNGLVLALLATANGTWADVTDDCIGGRGNADDYDGCILFTPVTNEQFNNLPDITFTIEYAEVVEEPDEPEIVPDDDNRRIIDISNYWIPIIRQTEQFKQIATAENPEFNKILDYIYRIVKESFILESTEYGVKRWETILGIVPTETMTLDERKTQILNYLNIRRSYTIRTLRQMLAAIVGEGNFTLSLDNDTQTLHLSLAISLTQVQVTSVKALMERVVPMNLVIEMTWENGMSVTDEYYPLEYVNIVKQFTHDSVITTNAPDVDLDMMYVYKSNDYAQQAIIASTSRDGYYGARRLYYFIPSYQTPGLRMVNDSANRTYFPTGGQGPLNTAVGRYDGKVPRVANRHVRYHIHDCGYTLNDTFYQFEPSEVLNDNWGKMLVGSGVTSGGNYYRIYRVTVKQHGETTADLVPCVRNSDGCEGLWCNVYKKFYEQSPVSTLDLDDEENGVTYFNIEEVNEND